MQGTGKCDYMAFGKKKNADEQDVQKAPKKKIKKVDVAQGFAFGILGIVMGLTAVIAICAANPDLTNMLSEVLKSGKQVEEPVKEAPVYAWNNNSSGTTNSSSYEDTEKNEVPNTENAATPDNDGGGTSYDTVSENVDSVADNIAESVQDAADKTEQTVQDVADKATAATQDAADKVAEASKDAADDTTAAAQKVVDDAAKKADEIDTATDEALANASAATDEIAETMETAAKDIAESAETAVNDAVAAVEGAMEAIPLVTIKTVSEEVGASEEPVEEAVQEYTPPVVLGKSAYVELTPDVIEVDNENQANQIRNGVDYGYIGDDLDFSVDFYPYYHMLNDDLKALYRQIYANAIRYNASFRPVISTSMENIKNAITSVAYDHPELFWLDTTFYTEYDYGGEAIKLSLRFYDRLGDLNTARNEFEAAANRILEGAAGLSSDYEKELYIHNVLADKLVYKHNSLDQSAYSGIAMDYTVCAGYAKAFQYLMQRLGIPAYLCVGKGANELHAWNIVRVNGEYYNVDCTWDDQNPTSYDYFNLSDRMNYMHTRMFQSVGLPACTLEPDLVIVY